MDIDPGSGNPGTAGTKPKPKGMRDIAKALGVSTGTVDRALHGKPGVNPMTRQRVLSMAQTMGYRPNLAARYLSSRREIRIAVNLPSFCSFFNEVWNGIVDAAAPFQGTGVRLIPRRYPNSEEPEIEAFEAALEDQIQALIISPGHPSRLKSLIRKAAQRSIPVLCLTTDAPGTERLASVSVDHFVSGSIAAELMGRFLPGGGDVLVVTGSLATVDHAEKVRGFQNCAASMFPDMRIAEVIEDHESEDESYAKSRAALTGNPSIKGIYASTGNSLPMLRAVGELELAKPKIITTDLFPALVPMLRSGLVAATIHQRPFTQGRMAFHALYRFLTENVCPRALIRLLPHLVLRTSLDTFLERDDHHLQAGQAYGAKASGNA